VTDTYNKALELDALHNSHPIEVPVGHPSEIREIFDDISYNKGAAVIRMLYNYVGDEVSSHYSSFIYLLIFSLIFTTKELSQRIGFILEST
jgi:hypothetical protein